MDLTHKDLVDIAYKWILNNGHCGIAFKELSTLNREIPDVIGFASDYSAIIECKVSRTDFLKDKNKEFRKNPQLGMGIQRFYCCPTNLIKIEELPDKWGLIYVNEKGKAKCVHKNYKGNLNLSENGFDRNIKAEQRLLYSALRRISLNGGLSLVYNNKLL